MLICHIIAVHAVKVDEMIIRLAYQMIPFEVIGHIAVRTRCFNKYNPGPVPFEPRPFDDRTFRALNVDLQKVNDAHPVTIQNCVKTLCLQ